MNNINYKAAYERQKKAREEAEDILEHRSRELFEANQSLLHAYNKLKNQKEQLLHQEKLASVGLLSAGIAHEINNPTAFVKSNISSLKRYVDDLKSLIGTYESSVAELSLNVKDGQYVLGALADKKRDINIDFIYSDVDDLLGESLEGVERIQSIVNSLKEISRPDSGKPEEVDVNECLENTLKIVWNQLKYKVSLEKSYGEIPKILGQTGSLSQVFVNVISNAAQAVDDDGVIKIITSVIDGEVVVKISDNGCGMEPAMCLKVFDPFFSTKGVGEGTGLGLSISHGIIKKHGGRMAVDSTLGVGTTFSVCLPLISRDQ